eukprot:gene13528-16479_t
MNQTRRSFIKITSLASVSLLPLARTLAQAIGEDDDELLKLIDSSFNSEYHFHVIDNNLLNLHFYFINAERTRKYLRQAEPGKNSFMIVRLPQMHISENGYWDTDWNKPDRKFPDTVLSGFSYLAFQLWPDDTGNKKTRKKRLEFSLENLLDWNNEFNFDLITLTEWFKLKNENKPKEEEKKQELIYRNLQKLSPAYTADQNSDFEKNKIWYKNKTEIDTEFNQRDQYYIGSRKEPQQDFNYKKYRSLVRNFLDHNFDTKKTGNDFIPITFLEFPARLCLVPIVRVKGNLAVTTDNPKKKFWKNKFVRRSLTGNGYSRYEVWNNTLYFKSKADNAAGADGTFSYQSPSFRVVGVISDHLEKIQNTQDCLQDCVNQSQANHLPSLLDKTELAFLTQYAKQDARYDFTQAEFDIQEVNGLFFTGLGVITHLKYYNVDQCPVEKGIDLIEYEHMITEGRDIFIKVARLGYNSKTGQRYKHVIEGTRRIDAREIKNGTSASYPEEPSSFIELKQYCECIDKHIIYNEAETQESKWNTRFHNITAVPANEILEPVKNNPCDFKRNVFNELTVIEKTRIPIRCLYKNLVQPQDVCTIQCLDWFWPVMEDVTKEGDTALQIPYNSYLLCEYEAKDWETRRMEAKTPFLFLRAKYIQAGNITDAYTDYFAGDYYFKTNSSDLIIRDYNLIERRKTYFNNQKIAFTPAPVPKLQEYLQYHTKKLNTLGKENIRQNKLLEAIIKDLKLQIDHADSSKSKTNILETDYVESYFNIKKPEVFGNNISSSKYIVYPQLLRANVFIDHIRDLTQQKISSVIEYHPEFIKHEFRAVVESTGEYANGAKIILQNTRAYINKAEEAASNTYLTISKTLQQAKARLGNLVVPDIIPDSISLEKFGITLPKDISNSIEKGKTVLTRTSEGLQKIASFNPIELLRGKLSDVCGLDLTKISDELLPADLLNNQTPLFEISKLLNKIEGDILNSLVYQQLINVKVPDPLNPGGPDLPITVLIDKYDKAILKLKDNIEKGRSTLNGKIQQISKRIPEAEDLDNLVKGLFEKYRIQAYELLLSAAEFKDVEIQIKKVHDSALAFFEKEKYLLYAEFNQYKQFIDDFNIEFKGELEQLPQILRNPAWLGMTIDDYIQQKISALYHLPDFCGYPAKIETLFKAIPENLDIRAANGQTIYYNTGANKSDRDITWELTAIADPAKTRKLLNFDVNQVSFIQLDKKINDFKTFISKNINGNDFQKNAAAGLQAFIKDNAAKLNTLKEGVNNFQEVVLGGILKDLDKWKVLSEQFLKDPGNSTPKIRNAIDKVTAAIAKTSVYVDFLRRFDPYFYYNEQQRLIKEVQDVEMRFRQEWFEFYSVVRNDIKTLATNYLTEEKNYAAQIKDVVTTGTASAQETLIKIRNEFILYRQKKLDILNQTSEKIIEQLISTPEYADLKIYYNEANKLKQDLKNYEKELTSLIENYKSLLNEQANDLKKQFDQKVSDFIEEQENKLIDTVGADNILLIQNTIAEAKNIYRLITSIKQQDLTYNWNTTSFRDVNLGIVTFKKFSNPQTALKVNVKATTFFSAGQFPPVIERVVTYSENRLSNFGISFFSCIAINFNEISFTAGSDHQTHFNVKIKDVKFEGALSFVQAFESWLKTMGKGLILKLEADHVSLGYSLPIPAIKTPAFSFSNLSLNFDLRVYFDNRPLLFAFSLARPESKFIIAAGIYAGFGFFSIGASPKRGIVEIDCALEAGAWAGISIGPIRGEVKLAFGFRYTKNDFGVRLEGYIVAEGRLSVWIIEVNARIYLGIISVNSYVEGMCTVTYSAKLGFIRKSFSGTFRKHIAGAARQNNDQQKQLVYAHFERLDKYLSYGLFGATGPGTLSTTDIERFNGNKKVFLTYLDKLDKEDDPETYHISMKKYFISSVVPNGFRIENNIHKLSLSVCLDLDIANLLQTENETLQDYYKRLQTFYKAFDSLAGPGGTFNHQQLKLRIRDRVYTGTVSVENPLKSYCDPKNVKGIRDYLWTEIFAGEKKKIEGSATIHQAPPITGSNLESLNAHLPLINELSGHPLVASQKLEEHFAAGNKYAESKNQIALNENMKSALKVRSLVPDKKGINITRNQTTFNQEDAEVFINEVETNFMEFTKTFIDPEEFINTFSSINNNIILKRLMGFIIDLCIEVPADLVPVSNGTSNLFNVQAVFNDPLWSNLIVPFSLHRNKNKYAYLIQNNNPFFKQSILNDSKSELLLFDKVAQEEKLLMQQQRRDRNEPVEYGEITDSFTRGILYAHPDLKDIIQPVSYERISDAGDTNIKEDQAYPEDFYVSGQRVAVNVKPSPLDSPLLLSLTNRSAVLKNSKGIPFMECASIEGTIHFDAVSSKIDSEGQVKHTTSDVLFEWSGEQLTLKSAFSKASSRSKLDKIHDKIMNQHDDGLWKSETKTRDHLLIDSFPYQEIAPEEIPEVCLMYGLPRKPDRKLPRLLFNSSYRFVIYHEYKNGWGLPLESTGADQLSVLDLLDDKTNFTKEITFRPLENIKPLKLFHTKKVNENAADVNVPLSDKESLEHLIVRSDHTEDPLQLICKRHVLPDKHPVQHLFWHGYLFSDKMPGNDSFAWKTKYNCPFGSKEEYSNAVPAKYKTCPEKCTAYCGGTHMKEFYPEDQIRPNYLTDPCIKGFSIRLFWDKAYQYPAGNFDHILFSGNPGTNIKSYLLKAIGAAGETHFKNFAQNDTIEVRLKKGAELYAQIITEITGEANATLAMGWWRDLSVAPSFRAVFNDKKFYEKRIPPKYITLTHAVKQPLIVPKIKNFYSTPTHASVAHIPEWLKKLNHQKYQLGINIIAERTPVQGTGTAINSTFAKINLRAHFERLDAAGKLEILKSILPTGSLQIWMRKEDYIDDPDQIVFHSTGKIGKSPEQPVVGFSDPSNHFILEHKIEFSSDILQQLKDLKNIEHDDQISDAFKAVTTSLTMIYDLKTTKFEEREYYLKNISKYKGYFSNEKLPEDDTALAKLEPYVLPKIGDVLGNILFRFKVITLNNKQPKKPSVSHAVTTIQENRKYFKNKRTESRQKGNMVTCYLKRNRLSSGMGEMVSLIINSDQAIYNSFFKQNNWISRAGKDIVSDRFSNRSKYLEYGDIITENSSYSACYDPELGMYHFLPRFDEDKQLWKFEIEFDIKTANGKQMHNPFINFSMVHFQPFSINYNNVKNPLDWKNDCRISAVETSVWCYLLPERALSVYFDKPSLFDRYGEVHAILSFDRESLHYVKHAPDNQGNEWTLRSNFILTVEGSNDGMTWMPVSSLNTEKSTDQWSLHHPLLQPDILNKPENTAELKLQFKRQSNPADLQQSQRMKDFRIRLIEIEWFTAESWADVLKRYAGLLNTGDISDNEELRIRY